MADEEEQRLAQQVYLVIRSDVDKDEKSSNASVLGVYFTDQTALTRAQSEFVDVLKETKDLDEDAEVDLDEFCKPGDEHLICLLTKEADKETGLFVSVRVEEHRVLDFSDVFETPGEEGDDEDEYEEDDGGEDDGEEGGPEGDQDDEDIEPEEEEDEDEPPAKVARKRG